jgi:hypothetical protein
MSEAANTASPSVCGQGLSMTIWSALTSYLCGLLEAFT